MLPVTSGNESLSVVHHGFQCDSRVVRVAKQHVIVTFTSAFAQLGDSKDLTLPEISRLTSVGDSARYA